MVSDRIGSLLIQFETDRERYAWIAAMIDAECSLLVTAMSYRNQHGERKRGYLLRLTCRNTSFALLEQLKTAIGEGSIQKTTGAYLQKHPKWRPTWSYTLTASGLRRLLPKVLPFLVAKKGQADLMIEAAMLSKQNTQKRVEERHKRLHEFQVEISSLNGRAGPAGFNSQLIHFRIERERYAWIGAMIDAECYLGVTTGSCKYNGERRTTYVIRLSCCNTSYPLLLQLRATVGEGAIHEIHSAYLGKHPEWRPQWQYTISAGGLRRLLPNVLPFLIAKNRQAELMIEALAISKGKGQDKHDSMLTKERHRRLHQFQCEISSLNGWTGPTKPTL